jgi:hypothetical protein
LPTCEVGSTSTAAITSATSPAAIGDVRAEPNGNRIVSLEAIGEAAIVMTMGFSRAHAEVHPAATGHRVHDVVRLGEIPHHDLGAGGAQGLGALVLAVHERTDRHVPVA